MLESPRAASEANKISATKQQRIISGKRLDDVDEQAISVEDELAAYPKPRIGSSST